MSFLDMKGEQVAALFDELEQSNLPPQVIGFGYDPHRREVLVGLRNGSWMVGPGAADSLLRQLAGAVLSVLKKHLPGYEWYQHWTKDAKGVFHPMATVLRFGLVIKKKEGRNA